MAATATRALVQTAARAMTGKTVLVPAEVQQERFARCEPCPHFIKDRCQLCGCFMRLKTRLAGAACPDNPPKWRKWELPTIPPSG